MSLHTLHQAIRSEVRGENGASNTPATELIDRLSSAERGALDTMRRRIRRADQRGKALRPPTGSVVWW